MNSQDFEDFKSKYQEIFHLRSTLSLLSWDLETCLPSGGHNSRAGQISTLSTLLHQKETSSEYFNVLKKLLPWTEKQDPINRSAAMVLVAWRDYQFATALPVDFVSEFSHHKAKCWQTWIEARKENNFKLVQPLLEKTLQLSLKQASYYKAYDHPMDPLVDEGDQGFSTSELKNLFQALRLELTPLINQVLEKQKNFSPVPPGDYEETLQKDFSCRIAEAIGFDFTRGRLDKAAHPFMVSVGYGDQRITTRYRKNDFTDCFFSVIHEVGHALYEQGLPLEFDGTPLYNGASTGIHESQSRLWENIVCRSLIFWKNYYPQLQKTFPKSLGGISLENFYRSINHVQPSLIRVDADEITYNMHVFVRFEIECALFENQIKIKDLPEIWKAKYKEYLGLDVPDDKDGCMQDVHWYGGRIGGYFQGYTLGNLLAAQLFESALSTNPQINTDLSQGKFGSLLDFLRKNIHIHGRTYPPKELIQKATHSDLSTQAYIRYLKNKYL